MTLEVHLRFAGAGLIALALLHAVFPRYFDWSRELSRLSLINRQMMQVHAFFIAVVVALIGVLAISSARLLVSTSLGHRVAAGIAVFWLLRLAIQWFGYSTKLWRGKRFETIVHVVFTCVWTYLTVLFFAVWLSGQRIG
ncbi:MAG: hypothetical protein AAFZ38_03095 [Myxococcota bacterium]